MSLSEATVVAWRWPNGFVCPSCSGREHCIVGKRWLFNCHRCQAETSIKAGTIFARAAAADEMVPGHVSADAIEERRLQY